MRTLNVLDLLDLLGIEGRKAADEVRTHCPNPKHARKPGPGSWQIRLTGAKAGQHVCYGCGFGGGPVALVAMVRGIDHAAARTWIRTQLGYEIPSGAEPAETFRRKPGAETAQRLTYPDDAVALWRDVPPELEAARAYCLRRGFTEAELALHHVAAVPEDGRRYAGRLILPIVVHGEMVDFVARLFVEKPKTVTKALSGRRDEGARKELSLWGFDQLDPAAPRVYVVEGIWGAIAMRRAGFANTVAACGSAWSDERTMLLQAWPEVVFLPDGDAAGSKLASRASGLRRMAVVRVADLGEGRQPDDLDPDELRQVVERAQIFRGGESFRLVYKEWTGKKARAG